jgi:hypothetical protein
VLFGPKAQPFFQPWATPRGSRNTGNSPRPNGPTVVQANGWAVGPKTAFAISATLGVAQGWENSCPFGAIATRVVFELVDEIMPLVRELDAANPAVRFHEREVETEHVTHEPAIRRSRAWHRKST